MPSTPFKRTVRRMLRHLGYELHPVTNARLPDMTWEEASKLFYFYRAYQHIKSLEGDVVECGVGHGYGLLKLAMLVRDEGRDRNVWGFDSFEGFPEPSEHDRRPDASLPKKGSWSTSPKEALELLRTAGLDERFVDSQVEIVKGFFKDTLSGFGRPIALLNADADLHDSYETILREMYPNMVPGGIILFDEYARKADATKWPGARRAIDSFLGEESRRIRIDPTGYAFLVKS